MRIGVLGGFGFLGQNLVPLLEQKYEVFCASRRNEVNALNLNRIIQWLERLKIDYLINLAANCGGIGLNQASPATLWHDTTLINTNVLEASRLVGIKKLVMIGTVCSYARNCVLPFKESDLMHYGFPEETNAGYGVAKLNGFFGCLAYRKQFNLNCIYLIPVNLYGKHDNFNPHSSHVIPALIKRMYDAKIAKLDSIKIWGDGSATREFLYAEDAAIAIDQALEKYDEEHPVNIGSGNEISIKDLVSLIKGIVGYEGSIVWDTSKPNGQPRRQLDVTLAKSKFCFVARTSFEEGLRSTVDWYISGLQKSELIDC